MITLYLFMKFIRILNFSRDEIKYEKLHLCFLDILVKIQLSWLFFLVVVKFVTTGQYIPQRVLIEN